MISATRILTVLCVALTAGCAGSEATPPGASANSRPLTVDPSLIGAKRSAPVVATPPSAGETEETPVTLAPPPTASADAAIGISPAAPANTAPPAARPAAKVAALPAVVAALPVVVTPPRKIDTPPVLPAKPEPALDVLDVADLKTRLRDTNAIGVFTKLALKNQMDDLLQQFRTQHQGGQKSSVASLRQPYDTLVLKVLSVIEGRDPSLARAISGSREAIWGVLADPIKFSSII